MSEPTRDDMRRIISGELLGLADGCRQAADDAAELVLSALAARGLDPVDLRGLVADAVGDASEADMPWDADARATLAKWKGGA